MTHSQYGIYGSLGQPGAASRLPSLHLTAKPHIKQED